MGKSTTPKYRIEMTEQRLVNGQPRHVPVDSMIWHSRKINGTASKGYGLPTDTNLEKWIYAYAKSLELGGVNEHISKSEGAIPYPTSAKIVNQFTGEVVAEWKAGMFQVW